MVCDSPVSGCISDGVVPIRVRYSERIYVLNPHLASFMTLWRGKGKLHSVEPSCKRFLKKSMCTWKV